MHSSRFTNPNEFVESVTVSAAIQKLILVLMSPWNAQIALYLVVNILTNKNENVF
jgi:hypothetical protein